MVLTIKCATCGTRAFREFDATRKIPVEVVDQVSSDACDVIDNKCKRSAWLDGTEVDLFIFATRSGNHYEALPVRTPQA